VGVTTVSVAEGIGDGGSGVEEGEGDEVKVTEAGGAGEREGSAEGVALGTSPDTQAANPKAINTIAKRVFFRQRMPAIFIFRFFWLGLGDTQDALQEQGLSSVSEEHGYVQKSKRHTTLCCVARYG
jgi:hypothetical protein